MKPKQILQGTIVAIFVLMILLFFSTFAVLSYYLLFDYRNNSESWWYTLIIGSLGIVWLFSLVFLNRKWKLGIKSSDFAE